MKKWFLLQLTETTAWIGLFVILAALFLPRSYIVFLGIVLIAVDDNIVKKWIAKISPRLAAKIEEWTNEI